MIKALAAAEGNELPGEEHNSDTGGEEEVDCGKGRKKRQQRQMMEAVFEIKMG